MAQRTCNKRRLVMIAFIACYIFVSSIFFIFTHVEHAIAESLAKPTPCLIKMCPPPKPSPSKTPKPTPSPSPSPTPKPKPTPSPTPSPTPRPGTTPSPGSNNPTPTPTTGSIIPTTSPTAAQTPLPQGPVPAATATAQAKQTPTVLSQSGNGGPPTTGANTGGPSTGMMVTYAALALALLAFLLYLIPRGQTPLPVKLLSLVLPSAVARRFGARQ